MSGSLRLEFKAGRHFHSEQPFLNLTLEECYVAPFVAVMWYGSILDQVPHSILRTVNHNSHVRDLQYIEVLTPL